MSSKYKKRALELIPGMEPWYRDINTQHKGDSRDGRTREECIWDSGVFAAAEFVRRLTGDEDLSALVVELCCFARKEQEKKSTSSPAH